MVRPKLGWAWVALTLSLAVHVADEAANDFLSVYNPVAQDLRARAQLPFPPVFEFQEWIIGLAVAVAALLALSTLAFSERKLARWMAVPFGLIMLGNGLGHVVASVVSGRMIPGVLSAPLLIVFSGLLLVAALGPPETAGTRKDVPVRTHGG